MELGGNIELVGFQGLDSSDLVVIKKMVGNFAKRLHDIYDELSELRITLQEVHRAANHESYELHGLVRVNDKEYESSVQDDNLYFCLNDILRKLGEQL